MKLNNELINLIINWADDKGLNDRKIRRQQYLKIMEEFGELCAGINKKQLEIIEDSIGDLFVTLIIFNTQNSSKFPSKVDFKPINTTAAMLNISEELGRLGGMFKDFDKRSQKIMDNLYIVSLNNKLDLNSCLETAYNVIANRKGKMIDGVFIKSEDLKHDFEGVEND